MALKHIKMHQWEEWQSYRNDRGTPPWIKVHRNLLSNHKWVELTDAEKGQLVSMWIVAADSNGILPDDARLIRKMAGLDEMPNLDKFKELNWVTPTGCQLDVNLASNGSQPDAPETETEAEAEVEKERKTREAPKVFVPDWLDVEMWKDFIDHRKALKKPMSERAKAMMIRELEILMAKGSAPNEVLRQSIINGWQGVFELKGNRNGQVTGSAGKATITDNVNAMLAKIERGEF